jgi:hypothetical protein
MTSNTFELVRKVKYLPGLSMTASIDPTQISTRIKNAAQKMLRTGILTAGYRSKSRLLAEQMLSDEGREAVVTSVSWGVFIQDVAILTPEARERIAELLEAAKLLDHLEHPTSADSTNARYKRLVTEIKRSRFGRVHLYLGHAEIQSQIAEVVSACRTPLMLEIHNELAAKLDGTEPFTITL